MAAGDETERYQQLLALHHGLKLNRRLGAWYEADQTREPVAYPATLQEQDQRLLAESVAAVAHASPQLIRRFYELLFTGRPFLRKLFPMDEDAMAVQHDKLLRALLALVDAYARPEQLAPFLEQLGRDHRKFGVRPVHYTAVGEALVAALREVAGAAWRDEYEQAWNRAYALAANFMIAAAEAAGSDPPFWYATVVEHELRHPDIAVLRLRPTLPYTYRPGQFTTVESPHLPRMWRAYSMATAPRQDYQLELHVRAVAEGVVSSALVHKTAVGDTLRLGPPIGSSVLAPDSRRAMLLLAGGTGLAPLKALVDELVQRAGRPHHRRVWLFVGARWRSELYDLADLSRLDAWFPWLSVVPVVSDDPEFPGERGTVPEVIGRYGHGSWHDHDVYVAGPPRMIRASLEQLAVLGVPAGNIHWDSQTGVDGPG
jgi:NAD(P)H-flavin reductase/hemoglobin-like flavoprotein